AQAGAPQPIRGDEGGRRVGAAAGEPACHRDRLVDVDRQRLVDPDVRGQQPGGADGEVVGQVVGGRYAGEVDALGHVGGHLERPVVGGADRDRVAPVEGEVDRAQGVEAVLAGRPHAQAQVDLGGCVHPY